MLVLVVDDAVEYISIRGVKVVDMAILGVVIMISVRRVVRATFIFDVIVYIPTVNEAVDMFIIDVVVFTSILDMVRLIFMLFVIVIPRIDAVDMVKPSFVIVPALIRTYVYITINLLCIYMYRVYICIHFNSFKSHILFTNSRNEKL